MQIGSNANRPHMVIIPATEHYHKLYDTLVQLSPGIKEEAHRIINFLFYHLVDACHEESAAPIMIQAVAGNFCNLIHQNMPNALDNQVLVQRCGSIVIALGNVVHEYLLAMKMYDEKGVLMYAHRPVNDPSFREIALDYVQRLSWNKQFYEPNPNAHLYFEY